MKMIIEISGGTVCNITSTDEASIYIVDHDRLKKSGDLDQARQAQQPDFIPHDGEENFDKYLNEALEEYEEE